MSNPVRLPIGPGIFFFRYRVQTVSGAHSDSEVRRPKHETNHSLSSSAEIKNVST
jgi:hypothetical protein